MDETVVGAAPARGPPPGKEHRKPENYYKDVLAGARLVADECTKDVIFE